MKNILENIRVLDLTNVLSGPFCTLHLALLGAEVIKIENPKGGDLARSLGCKPEYNKALHGTSFLAQNANKKSITLNLKDSKAIEIFKKLVEKSDVVVENFRPNVMNRLGIGYEQLVKVNPKIIYLAISGFGQTGPDAFKPAYDQIIQGLSGIMAINGDKRLNPLRAAFPVCDTIGGINGAFAVMAALFYRERTGIGQFIDVALLDSVLPFMGWVVANLTIGQQQPQLLGNDNFTAAPSGTFRTRDGNINIAANKQEQWHAVTDILELPELKEDIRFKERDNRKANRNILTPILEEKLMLKNTDEWVELLNAAGVPSGKILSLEDALSSEQINHRNTFTEININDIGNIKLFNLTAKFSKTPGNVTTPPPTLSEHTNEILNNLLGYSAEQIKELKQQGII